MMKYNKAVIGRVTSEAFILGNFEEECAVHNE